MRIGSAFPSKFLKASDIPDGSFVNVVVDHVAVEDVAGNNDPDDRKPVLYFRGKQKGMVLNKTNSTSISQAYGDETDDWGGKPLLLYSTETLFQGSNVPCLRVKIPKGAAAQSPARQPAREPVGAGAPATKPAPEQPFGDEEQFKEDDIPF